MGSAGAWQKKEVFPRTVPAHNVQRLDSVSAKQHEEVGAQHDVQRAKEQSREKLVLVLAVMADARDGVTKSH